jgi:hypothetical protein
MRDMCLVFGAVFLLNVLTVVLASCIYDVMYVKEICEIKKSFIV